MELSSKRSATAPKLVLEPVRQSPRMESRPLSVGRYLIGSASEADITINVPGVAPQHCLMIVGANKTVVKAISPLTWINDGPLTEAVLKHGERLILGPVELRTRLPEVSEWVSQGNDEELELKSPAPLSTKAESQYEPPQIEELLDQARQHLQSAIDLSADSVEPWSEDLPLSEAVQLHSATTPAAPLGGDVDVAPEAVTAISQPLKQTKEAEEWRAELDQRALEIGERARAVEYLSTELSTREEQLLARERELIGRESRLQSIVDEVDQREEALIAEERALQARIQQTNETEREAALTAAQQLEERTRVLDEEQSRVQQLLAVIEQQYPELQRQSEELAARQQTLDAREAELTALEASLYQQSQEIQALAAVPVAPADTSAIELRESALAKREAVLATSMATLQASREQIAEESAQLEQRFAELVEREQAWQRRSAELGELAQRTEADAENMAARLADLEQREAVVQSTNAAQAERDAALLKLKADVEAREQVLIALRAELDTREESLNQQFAQLQKDRAGMRSSQLKQQMAEQAGKQHLSDLEEQLKKRAEELDAEAARVSQLQESHAQQLLNSQSKAIEVESELQLVREELQSLQQQFAEREQSWTAITEKLVVAEKELAASQAQLAEAHAQLAETQQKLADLQEENAWAAAQPVVLVDAQSTPSPEIEQQWAELAQAQAELAQDQQEMARWRTELEELQTQLESDRKSHEAVVAELSQPSAVVESQGEADDTQFGVHLQALLDERRSLTELREDVEREYKSLRAEREEASQARLRFEQERAQLDAIKTEAASERDVFLIERQSVISQRQTLEEREREIRQREAVSEQLKADAQKIIAGLDLQQRRLDEQRVHLEEEWESLREEREVQRQAEAQLEAQRQELTSYAQQLEQYQLTEEPVTLDSTVIAADESIEECEAEAVAPAFDEEPIDEHDLASDGDAVDGTAAEIESHEEQDEFEEEVVDPLAGFASFSSIGGSSDEMLPPEIAEIIRRVGGQSPAPASPPASQTTGPAAHVEAAPMASKLSNAQEAPAREDEQQRLKELLEQPSESYVDAASVQADAAPLYDDSEAFHANEQDLANWENDSQNEAGEHPVDPESQDAETSQAEVNKSIELRSRLSEMFGIDLGPLRGAVSNSSEDRLIEAAAEESVWEEDVAESAGDVYEQEESNADSTESTTDESQQLEAEYAAEEEPASDGEEAAIDESLDPVAAYMEQLLARTRKASSKAPPAPPKVAPPPIAPVVPLPSDETEEDSQEVTGEVIEEVVPKPMKPIRKSEPVDKNALRANLDSFRTIANTQARSNVARSESKRLILMSQAKQIFLVSSAIITVVLLSTEFWTERKYRLEMLAGVIATTFLGFDYYRTQRRLRQLGLLSGGEYESLEDDKNSDDE